MLLPFTKMHGLGNDFVVIDAVTQEVSLSPEIVRHLSDRHFGIGCDQLLVVEPPQRPDVDFHYRIFNADGGEVGQCGNGARCLARFVREQKLTTKTRIRVETTTGILELAVLSDDLYQVALGVPRFAPEDIPFVVPARAPRYQLNIDGQNHGFSALSLGNPHAVLEVAAVAHAPVAELGAKIGEHPNFPEGVNVGFMAVRNRHTIDLRVFERGAGETLACGSGACAAAVAGIQTDLLDSPVRVHLPGGTLTIDWAGEGQPVLLTGPAVTVYQGRIRYEPKKFRRAIPHD
ncbi:MAG: diaminopimelate epimerase [Gammaproteobacteria bacterium]|nr:diaminopimelate epimerase [Gammaproteobacteria bacterium]